MHLTASRGHARIPADHRDAAIHRLFQGRNQRVGIVCRNCDSIDPLRDQGVDHLDLAFCGGVRRAGIDDFDIAQFGGRLFGTFCGGFKEADPQRFDNDGNSHFLGLGRAGQKGSGYCHG